MPEGETDTKGLYLHFKTTERATKESMFESRSLKDPNF